MSTAAVLSVLATLILALAVLLAATLVRGATRVRDAQIPRHPSAHDADAWWAQHPGDTHDQDHR